MGNRRIIIGIVVGVTAVLLLAGCIQPPPPIIPTSGPSAAPVFASDAAALAAAKKAFTGYVAESNTIGNDGGNHPERIAPWVTSSRLKTETTAFAKFAQSGDHLTGGATYAKFALQELDDSNGHVSLTAYACDEVAGTRLINPSGTDITPSTRQDQIPLEIRFENKSKGSSVLLVDGSDPWSGSNFCS
jgi:hypothetical protein